MDDLRNHIQMLQRDNKNQHKIRNLHDELAVIKNSSSYASVFATNGGIEAHAYGSSSRAVLKAQISPRRHA